MSNRLLQLELYYLHLPFRRKFSHAAASRAGTDTLVCAALLADGTIGYGEGLPRKYVTGESIESMIYNITGVLARSLQDVEPGSFYELLELADTLPFSNSQDHVINAARCCVELALLDAYSRYFGVSITTIGQWLGYAPFTRGGSPAHVAVSGVLDGSKPEKTAKTLRLQRWYGLRDFKLKMGYANDEANLQTVYKRLKKPLDRQEMSLRVDANGAWDIDTATAMCEMLVDYQVCCLEQPLAAGDRSHFNVLASLSPLPLMADESLVTLDDARYLVEHDLVDFFNIRISKNGGLIPSLRLAEMADRHGLEYQLGAMVGETGILTAAGIRFLQMVPNIIFTEIGYATFLLRQDITTPRLRFGYGGRLPIPGGLGLGIRVNPGRLRKYLVRPPQRISLA